MNLSVLDSGPATLMFRPRVLWREWQKGWLSLDVGRKDDNFLFSIFPNRKSFIGTAETPLVSKDRVSDRVEGRPFPEVRVGS